MYWGTYRTLLDDIRDSGRRPSENRHEHFHHHDGARHAHSHRHSDVGPDERPHAHSNRTDAPPHA